MCARGAPAALSKLSAVLLGPTGPRLLGPTNCQNQAIFPLQLALALSLALQLALVTGTAALCAAAAGRAPLR
jgi:hypothetical protein